MTRARARAMLRGLVARRRAVPYVWAATVTAVVLQPLVAPLARTPEEWAVELGRMSRRTGGHRFHARQLFRWLHVRGVLEPERMSDLPKDLRAALAERGVGPAMHLADERRAPDGTRKLLLRLRDGVSIETVLIPGVSGGRAVLPNPLGRESDADAAAAVEDDELDGEQACRADQGGGVTRITRITRVTQCVSTQVGCAMGCVFCASGVAGLKRHLGADEIVAQVIAGRAHLGGTERLTNVVFMGMGEPLHNYDATARALRLLTHADGIALSPRRITVSTSGLIPEIARLGADFAGQIGLAVSLHAADDETRSRLMPINKKYPLAALMAALRAYPLPRRRRITIEYTLVAGRNDSPDEATKVARLLRGLPVKVNLIPMNPIEASSLAPPDMNRVLAFQRVLCAAGYSCFVRRRRGDEVAAACGQLALLGAKPKVRVNRG